MWTFFIHKVREAGGTNQRMMLIGLSREFGSFRETDYFGLNIEVVIP